MEVSSPNGPFYVNRDLIKTSLNARKGDTIKITSTGIVDFGGAVLGIGAPKLDANGDFATTPQNYPAPNLRKNSLIIKIGDKWYQGGTGTSFIASTEGSIQLYANDNDPGNNTGAWKVFANVTPASAEWFGPWIRALYHDLLGRPPENENVVQTQVEGLRKGRSPKDVVNQFLTSQEYCYGRAYWMYQHFLDREPEPGAREARGQQFMQGMPFQTMISDFCESPEFKAKHPVPKEFVRFLYYKILGRSQDPEVYDQAGFNHQVAAINSGTATRDIINNFLRSLEYAYVTANEYFVKFLRREHVQDPQSTHVKKIMSGAPLQEEMKDILCSEEYINGSVSRYVDAVVSTPPPVTDPCQPIEKELAGLNNEKSQAQAELLTAPTGAKPALLAQIRELNNEINAKQAELQKCRQGLENVN